MTEQKPPQAAGRQPHARKPRRARERQSEPGAPRPHAQHQLADLVAGYVICLRRSLQGNIDMEETEVFLPDDLRCQAERFGNPPTCVAFAISAWIEREYRAGHLSQQLVRHMEDQLSKLVDAQGACEKIRKTPLPFVYVALAAALDRYRLVVTADRITLRAEPLPWPSWFSVPSRAVDGLRVFRVQKESKAEKPIVEWELAVETHGGVRRILRRERPDELYAIVRTVEGHISRILDKKHLSNRVELALHIRDLQTSE